MKQFLQAIDSKTITSAGGIVIALMLGYLLYDVGVNKTQNIANSVSAFAATDATSKDRLAEALIQNAKALEGNTKVMEQVLRQK